MSALDDLLESGGNPVLFYQNVEAARREVEQLRGNHAVDFRMYSILAIRTASILTSDRDRLINSAMGLAGEAGEFVELIKKHLFHGHDLDKEHVIKELGDVLWYINLACDAVGVKLENIALENIAKLNRRYPGGKFEVDLSRNRCEGDV